MGLFVDLFEESGKLFKALKKTDKDIDDFMKELDDEMGMWNIVTVTSNIDVTYTCPHCKKIFGMESRFLEPGKKASCLYCDKEIVFPTEEEKEEK